MIHALSMTGLTDAVQQRNYTVFAPVDEAFASYKPLQDANLNVVRVSPNSLNSVTDILEDIVSGHIIEGRVRTNDFVNDQLFDTALKAGTIRLNKYNMFPQKILTANCVPLINADVLTTNGVVHVVERVLPNARQTLEQLVLSHPDLTTFASVVSRLGLSETGPFTLFAPSNAAFDRLDLNLRDRLLSPDSCELKILRQHILPSVVCSASIIAGFRVGVLNVDDRYITLRHIPDTDVLTVEGANTTDTDIMATNGVLHIIDSVLFEQAASNLLEVAKRVGGASKFLKLVELSGVQSRLNSLDNFTMFLPTDEAIKAIADRLGNMSTTQLEQLVEYHIVPEQRRLNKDLHSDQQLPSMSSGNHLQIKHYHSFPFGAQSRKTVQCATFVTTDINNGSVCSGIGHIINTVLIPPVNSVLDVLMSDRKFSNVMQLIKTSGLTELLQQQDSHVTFFAPTNQAFESLSPDLLNQLRSSPEIARHVLRSHMLADVLCCAGIFPRRFLQMAVREVNLDGWMIAVDRLQNTVHYGNVPVQSCDMMAANGVVHTVNTFVPSAIARYITTQDEDDDSSLETLWDRLWDL
jgi:transforming growth factor-beta-induced protein